MNSYIDAIKSAALAAAKSGEPHCVGRGSAGFDIWSGVNALRAHVRVNPDGSSVEVPERTVRQVYSDQVNKPKPAKNEIGVRVGAWTGD